MRRELHFFPDPILHTKAKPVKVVDDEIRKLLDDMAETMYANDGVGLAAPQVGVLQRCICIDVSGRESKDGPGLIKIVNPEILESEGEIDYEEGCLSIPEFRMVMHRSNRLKVKYLDENGAEKIIDAEGLLAVAFQQEIDHLNGILIIDSATPIKREMWLKKRKE